MTLCAGECDKRREKLMLLQRAKMERHMREMDTLIQVRRQDPLPLSLSPLSPSPSLSPSPLPPSPSDV